MVNPVGKYKYWSAVDSNTLGTTASDFWPALEAELDAWITAISGNASMTGYLPIKKKGYADSTSANYMGFTVELPHPTNPSIYMGSYSTSTTSRSRKHASAWTDSGSEGGYGSFSGTSDTETTGWTVTGRANGIFLAYDTTDTQEFFTAGYWDEVGTSVQDNIVLFVRGTDGTWGSFFNDSSTNHILWYSDKSGSAVSTNVETGSYYSILTSSLGEIGIGGGARFTSANPRLLGPKTGATGSYFADGSYSAYITAYYGPIVVLG